MIAVVQPSPAKSLHVAAQDLFAGVVALSSGGPQVHIAFTHLASQSLECALKAYLSHAGVSVDKLKRKPYGHNLESIWEKASQAGLGISAAPPVWCTVMNQSHDYPYCLRYRMNQQNEGISGLSLPPIAAVIRELEQLIKDIEAKIK